ncbi:MAG: head-tail adaptor protein [Rhodobacteraceae bacterium]|nr:head-tail adaptor protein [Paracoccaceae bacterium]
MRAPVLSRKLTLEDPTRASDGSGGHVEAWQGMGEIWAEIHSLTGRSKVQGGVDLSLQRYRITVRATPVGSASRPRPDQRFREGARLFLIDAVAEADDSGRYLTCFVQEEISA